MTLPSDGRPAGDQRAERNPRLIGVGDTGRPAIGWTEIGIAALAYLVLSGLLIFAVAQASGGMLPTLGVVVASGVAALLTTLIAISVRVRSAAALGLRRVSRQWVLYGIAAGLAVWVVNRLVVIVYVLLTGDPSNPQASLTENANSTPGLLALLAAGAILVPIAEESLFRGVLFGGLRRYGFVVAMLTSSVVFGLAHGISIVLPAAIILGAVGAFLYEKSGSIWPAVISHAVNNAIIFSLVAVLPI
jgi:membrane protease YdiL (CAAX protease family)